MAKKSSVTLTDRLADHAQRRPERTVFTFWQERDAQYDRLSFGELHELSLKLAAELADADLAGKPVLLLYPPGLDFIVAFFACMAAAAVPVPMPIPRRANQWARIHAVCAHIQVRAVLALDCAGLPALAQFAPHTLRIDATLATLRARGAETMRARDRIGAASDALAFLQFTSGSTGEPKGVEVTHRNLIANQEQITAAFGVDEASIGVGWLPLFHDMGLVGNVLNPVHAGYSMALLPPAVFLHRPQVWLDLIGDLGATVSGGPNFAFQLCVDRIGAEAQLNLTRWRSAFCGAERIVPATLAAFAAKFAPFGFDSRALLPCYGLAESTLFVSAARSGQDIVLGEFPAVALEGSESQGPAASRLTTLVGLGRPGHSTEVVIADPQRGAVVATGDVGEIWVSGPAVARGYVGRAQLTRDVFQRYLSDGRGPWLATGDLGLLDATGELYVAGRLKEMMIVNGRNLYPQDLEEAACAVAPEINPMACAAFSIPAAATESVWIRAELRRERLRTADRSGVERRVREAIAATFDVALGAVILESPGILPRTTSGKLQRVLIRQHAMGVIAAQPAKGRSAQNATGSAQLALVSAIAGHDLTEQDLDLSAAALGLSSLQAHQLAVELERLGIAVLADEILEARSVREVLERGAQQPLALPSSEASQELTEQELALLYEQRRHPHAAIFTLCIPLRVQPLLDPARLRQAFMAVLTRHPQLARVVADAAVPRWQPCTRLDQAFIEQDVGGHNGADVQRLVQKLSGMALDPESGPLLQLHHLRGAEQWLVLHGHHLVCDLTSLAILMRDLERAYSGTPLGPALPPGQFAHWQRQWLNSPQGKHASSYWHEQWSAGAARLPWACDETPQTVAHEVRGVLFDTEISSSVVAAAAAALNATGLQFQLAALVWTLCRWTSQHQITIAVPMLGRPQARFAEAVGYFVQPVMLSFDLRGIRDFAQLLKSVRETMLSAGRHQWYPLARRGVLGGPGTGEFPYQVLFTSHESSLLPQLPAIALGLDNHEVQLGEWQLRAGPTAPLHRLEQLSWQVGTVDGRMYCRADYQPAVISVDLMESLLRHWAATLRCAVDDSSCVLDGLTPLPIERVSLLSNPRREVNADWLATILEHAARDPLRAAVISAGNTWSYGELLTRAWQIAAALEADGVGREAVVGVLQPRSPLLVATLLGILLRGACYLPLDPAYPEARLRFCVDDACPGVLLTSVEHATLAHTLGVERTRTLSAHSDASANGFVHCSPHPEQRAVLIYTSGSTGRPKGVELRHGGVAALLQWSLSEFDPDSWQAVAATTSICFDLSIFELFATLHAGGTIHLYESAATLASAEAASDASLRLLNTVPSAARELLSAHGLPQGLRVLNLAGEPLSERLVAEIGSRYPHLQINNLYGPTEDTTYSTHARIGTEKRCMPGEPGVPLGQPLPGTDVYLVDSQYRPIARGITGEIMLAGQGLARGYHGAARLTAERFVPDPLSRFPGGRAYRTGDLARLNAAGELEFHGRLDQQIKVRGFRVELGEVTAALAGLQQVREAAVLLHAPSESDRRLIAYASLRAEASPEELLHCLRAILPPFAVPSQIVLLERLPRLPNGKVDLTALSGITQRPELTPPATPLESQLLEIWRGMLQQPQLGVTEDFIAAGGYSMLALRLAHAMSSQLNRHIETGAILRERTVRRLAAALESDRGTVLRSTIAGLAQHGRAALTPAQRGIYLQARLDPNGTAYHMPFILRLRGALRPALLRDCFAELARRHPSLCSRYFQSGDNFFQQIVPGMSISLQVVAEEDADTVAARLIGTPFDLEGGEAIRATLVQAGPQLHDLVCVVHHIAADGWSAEILKSELGSLYRCRIDATPSPVAPSTRFVDWAESRTRAQADLMQQDGAFWREYFKEMDGIGDLRLLPGDSADSPTYRHALDARRWRLIQEFAKALQCTPYEVLLTLIAWTLGRLCDQPAIVITAPRSRREEPQLEAVTGLFLDNLPVRVDTAAANDLGRACRQVTHDMQATAGHAGLSLGEIIATTPYRSAGAIHPLQQVCVNFLDFPQHEPDFGAVSAQPVAYDLAQAKYALTCYASHWGDGLALQYHVCDARFGREGVAAVHQHLEQLVDTALHAATPPVPSPAASLPSTGEPAENLAAAAGEFPPAGIAESFRQSAAAYPARIAIVSDELSWTYAEVFGFVEALRSAIHTADLPADSCIGVLSSRSPWLAVAILACLHTRHPYTVLEIGTPADRTSAILSQVPIALWLLTDEDSEQAALALALPPSRCLRVRSTATKPGANIPEYQPAPPNAAACLTFTSGSSGTPRGVIGQHASLSAHLPHLVSRFEINPADRFAMLAGLMSDPLQRDVLVPLALGASVAVPDETTLRSTQLGPWLQRQQVTVINLTPAAAQYLVVGEAGAAVSLECVRWIFFCGDRLRWEDVRATRARAPRCGVVNLYGMTESQRALTELVCVAPGENLPHTGRVFVDIAAEGASTRACVQRADGSAAAVYEPGEVFISGRYIATGYHNSPRETAERFVPAPHGRRVLRTGDRARTLPDGSLEYLGRLDRQVNIRGTRISLHEIESLASRIAGVERCCAIVREDARQDPYIALYWSASPGHGSAIDVRNALGSLCAPAMLPQYVIQVREWPLNRAGKTDVSRLPACEHGLPAAGDESLPDPVAEQIRALWSQELKHPAVSLDDNFFALGGHSLMALRLCERITQHTGVSYRVHELLKEPTLRACIEHLRARDSFLSQSPAHASVEITRREDNTGPFPLTPVQRAYWLGRNMDFGYGGSTSSVAYAEFALQGTSVQRIEAIVRCLIARHPALRTTLSSHGLQQEVPTPEFHLAFTNCSALSAGARASSALNRRAAMETSEFDPMRWPLFALHFTQTEATGGILHIAIDMLVVDFLSAQVLMTEFQQLHENPAAPLPPLRLRFRDYVAFLEARTHHPAYHAARDYWLQRLAHLPPGPDLPVEPAPASGPPRFSRRDIDLSEQQWGKFAARAAQLSVTRAALLATVFSEVLASWAKQRHFCLNLPVFDRPPGNAEIQRVVGDFTSLLLLEVDLRSGSIAQRARAVHRRLISDLQHSAFGGIEVLRELSRHHGDGRARLMPVVFTYTLDHDPGADAATAAPFGLQALSYRKTRTPQVWLDHGTSRRPDGISLSLTTLDGVFSEAMLDEMTDAYRTALLRAIDTEGALEKDWLVELPAAQSQQRMQYNRTERSSKPGRLIDAFLARCHEAPERPAVCSTERTLSYGQLLQQAKLICNAAQRAGVRSGDVVAVLLPKGWQQIPAVLGVLMAGATYLPVDPTWPPGRIEKIMRAGAASAAIANADFPVADCALHDCRFIVPDAVLDGVARPDVLRASPDDAAYIIFTSGSTGTPKGVVMSHRAALNTIEAINELVRLAPDDGVLALSGLSFDLSVWDIFGVLAAGARIVIPTSAQMQNPRSWLTLAHDHGATIWNSVPALLQVYLDGAVAGPAEWPAQWRTIMLSGDWIAPHLAQRVRASAPDVELISLGGATEAAIWSIYYPVNEVEPHAASIPYGRPLRNQSIHVLDEQRSARPLHAVGEIHIGGIGLAREYVGDPQRTRASFIVNHRTGERLYRTGDLGRVTSTGDVELLGRMDTQIKLAGHRIELGEIEAALARLPGVVDVAAVLHAPQGATAQLVAFLAGLLPAQADDHDAYVELAPQAEEPLRRALERELPSYMVPRVFVALGRLPLSANGKVDRRKLASVPIERRQDAPPEPRRHDNDPVEQAITAVWQDLLRLPRAPASGAGFFELGGDSVLALQCIGRVNSHFELSLGVQVLYQHGQLGGFARAVRRHLQVQTLQQRQVARSDMESGTI